MGLMGVDDERDIVKPWPKLVSKKENEDMGLGCEVLADVLINRAHGGRSKTSKAFTTSI